MRGRSGVVAAALGLCLMGGLVSGVGAQAGSFGVEGGVNFSTAITDPDADAEWEVSGGVGVLGELGMSPMWMVEAGVFWMRNGATVTLDGVQADVALDYIQVPLRLKWVLSEGMPVVPFIFAGANLGFIVNAEGEAEGTIANFRTDLSDEFTTFDVGIDAGLGLGWDMTQSLRVYARGWYTAWLLDIADGDAVIGNINEWRNQEIKVTAGISWLFGGSSTY